LTIKTRVGLVKLVTIPVMLVLAAVLQLTMTAPAQAATAVGGNAWSGIIDRGTGISHVSGRIVVPKVDTACGTNSNAAIWVGLGGYGTFPFAQNGITVAPSGVWAWYELFDKSGRGPAVAVSLPMKAGDAVALSVAFSAGHTVLTFTWINLTRNQKVTRTFYNAAQWYNGSTAEWIVERAAFDVLHDSPYLAHFSPITFTNAVSGTPTTGRSAFPATYISTMNSKYVNSSYHPLARVTPLANTQAFTTTWLGCH
jgi:Peptidase A4 family